MFFLDYLDEVGFARCSEDSLALVNSTVDHLTAESGRAFAASDARFGASNAPKKAALRQLLMAYSCLVCADPVCLRSALQLEGGGPDYIPNQMCILQCRP